jgi:hypothetical protein
MEHSVTLPCITKLQHPCAVRICLMLGTVLLLMRDAFLIRVTYLILGIRKTVSLNVFNVDHNTEDYDEITLTLTYLSPCMVH